MTWCGFRLENTERGASHYHDVETGSLDGEAARLAQCGALLWAQKVAFRPHHRGEQRFAYGGTIRRFGRFVALSGDPPREIRT